MTTNPVYILNNSWWPLLAAFSGLSFMTSFLSLLWLKSLTLSSLFLAVSAFMTLTLFYLWGQDLQRESALSGQMTETIENSLKFSFILFISSEVMFFMSFFWAFFHYSLSPDPEIGTNWPPLGVEPIPFFETPLLNTIILLTSGITITWAHHAFFSSKSMMSTPPLTAATILLGVYFTYLQLEEYTTSNFSMNDSCYGSVFFLSTGFHGLHILVGSMFLVSLLPRMVLGFNSSKDILHFELAAWYWHFVDVVWLFLYICMYWWGE
uniref:Cytochrome c oxidase subunit 3 n=1 Tax=Gordius sp. VVA-2019 TaxID=2586752 RepID=A0A514ABT0_9BILA|nr:cytochrome c oxidase subunit 3 [Gordius sp. VVA-2019]